MHQRGFTLVELSIAIVVIAILFAISVVSYGFVQRASHEQSLKAELSNAAKQAEVSSHSAGGYAANESELNDGNGFSHDASHELTYTFYPASYTFCITGTTDIDGVGPFYIESTSTDILSGSCP